MLTIQMMCEQATELGRFAVLGHYPTEQRVIGAVCQRSGETVIQFPEPHLIGMVADAYDRALAANQPDDEQGDDPPPHGKAVALSLAPAR
jgi:hypothetical protein